MNILITGSRGQLGCELQRILAEGRAEIGAIPVAYADAQVTAVDYDELDITDEAAVVRMVDGGRFDLIINCAAATNVDGCEDDEPAAFDINANGPEYLARAAQASGAKIVQVSTDYVFPGTDPTPRTEDDPTGPLSAYGRTKRAGEQAVAEECPRSYIVRTAWLYGYRGRNFVKTMLSLGETHDRVEVVDDQRGNPTSANDLAYEILKIAATDNFGIYHCTNEGVCSWAEFARAIMEGAGLDCEVVPVTSAEYKQAHPASADRPAWSALENRYLSQTVGNEMRPWQDALSSYLGNLDESEGR